MRLSPKQINFLRAFLYFFIAWLVMSFIFVVTRYYDANEVTGVPLGTNSLQIIITLGVLISFIMAIISAIIEPIVLRIKPKRLPFFLVFMFRTQRFLIVIIILYLFAVVVENMIVDKIPISQWKEVLTNTAYSKFFHLSVIYIIFANILINSIRQMTRFLGETVFWKYIFGKYSTENESERIFMFIDLKSSTSIAEILDNIKYSNFLKKFYFEISFVINENRGIVYQYVGDEIVITWDIKDGLYNNNCIKCFFDIKECIKEKREEFLSEFGIIPEFRAALHIGNSVAAEVGTFKTELAYHGNVLNTTSRILAKCHELKSDLLFSGELYNRLLDKKSYNIIKVGEFILRGKMNVSELYSIQ